MVTKKAEKSLNANDTSQMDEMMRNFYLKENQIISIEKLKEIQENEMTELYKEVLQSAQLEWNWVIEPGEYDDIQFLGGEYIAVKKKNGKYGIVNGDGAFICSEEYDFISAYSEDMASAEKNRNIFILIKKEREL